VENEPTKEDGDIQACLFRVWDRLDVTKKAGVFCFRLKAWLQRNKAYYPNLLIYEFQCMYVQDDDSWNRNSGMQLN
jgi:hypothetical protein